MQHVGHPRRLSSGTQESSSSSSSMFALRLVTLDHYLAAPSAPLDPLVSKLGGWEVWQVPVVRIFGVTPAGQKACLHVHGAMPYLTVPCAESRPERFAVVLASEIDLLLNTAAGRATSMHRHVHHVAVIRATRLYGFHDREETFLRIFLYNPLHVTKVAELLLSGMVQKRAMQPHEAHIPFALQFMVDHNLHGMSFVRVEAFKFRQPTTWVQDKGGSRGSGDNHWDLHSLPAELFGSLEKQTTCELELDCCARDILNASDDKEGLNPGLAALWQEEEERRQEPVWWTPLSIEDEGFPCTESEQFYLARLDKRLARPAVDEQDRPGTKETRRKHHSRLLDTSHAVLDSQDEALAEVLAQAASSWSQGTDGEEDSILGSLPGPDVDVADDEDEDNVEDMSQVFQLVGDREQDDDGASSMSDQSDGNEAYDPFQLDGADDMPGGAAARESRTRDQGTQTGARPPVLVRRLLGRARTRRCTRLSLRRQQRQQATQEQLLRVGVPAATRVQGQSPDEFGATPPVAEDWQRWQSCHVASLLMSPESYSTPSTLTAGSPAPEPSPSRVYALNACYSLLEAMPPCCVSLLRLTEAEIERWQRRPPPVQVRLNRRSWQEPEAHGRSRNVPAADMPKSKKRHRKRGRSTDNNSGNMVLRSSSPAAKIADLRKPASSYKEGPSALQGLTAEAVHCVPQVCWDVAPVRGELVPGGLVNTGTENVSKRPKTRAAVTGSTAGKRASKSCMQTHLVDQGEGKDSLELPAGVSAAVDLVAGREVSSRKERLHAERRRSSTRSPLTEARPVSSASTLSSPASSLSPQDIGGLSELKANECRPSVICRIRIRGRRMISTTTTRLVPCVVGTESDGRFSACDPAIGLGSCKTDVPSSIAETGPSTPTPLKSEAGGDSPLLPRSDAAENGKPSLSEGKASRQLARSKLSSSSSPDAFLDASISDLVSRFSRCGVVVAASTAVSEPAGTCDIAKCDLSKASNLASSTEDSTKKKSAIAQPTYSELADSVTLVNAATAADGNMSQLRSKATREVGGFDGGLPSSGSTTRVKEACKRGRPRKSATPVHSSGDNSTGGAYTDTLSVGSHVEGGNMAQSAGRLTKWHAAKLSSNRVGVRRSSRLEAFMSPSSCETSDLEGTDSSPRGRVSMHSSPEGVNLRKHLRGRQSGVEEPNSPKLLSQLRCHEGGDFGKPLVLTNSELVGKGAAGIAAGKFTLDKKAETSSAALSVNETAIIDEESVPPGVGCAGKTRKSVSMVTVRAGSSKASCSSALITSSLRNTKKKSVCTPSDAGAAITHELKQKAKSSRALRKQQVASPPMPSRRLRTRSVLQGAQEAGVQKMDVSCEKSELLQHVVPAGRGVVDRKHSLAAELPTALSRDDAAGSREPLSSSFDIDRKESARKRGRPSKLQYKCGVDIGNERATRSVSERLVPDLTNDDLLLSCGSNSQRACSPALAKAHIQPIAVACVDAEEEKSMVRQTRHHKTNIAVSDAGESGSRACMSMPVAEPVTSDEAVAGVNARDQKTVEELAVVAADYPTQANDFLHEMNTLVTTESDVAELAGTGAPVSRLPLSSDSKDMQVVWSPVPYKSAEDHFTSSVGDGNISSLSSGSTDEISKFCTAVLTNPAEHLDKHINQQSNDFKLNEPSSCEGAMTSCAEQAADVLRKPESAAEASSDACSEQQPKSSEELFQPEAGLLSGDLTDDVEVVTAESAGTEQAGATPANDDCLRLSSDDEGNWILLDEAGEEDSVELFSSEMAAECCTEPASSEGYKEHVNSEEGIGDVTSDGVSHDNLVSFDSSESFVCTTGGQRCAEDVSSVQHDSRICLGDVCRENGVEIGGGGLARNTASEGSSGEKHSADVGSETCAVEASSDTSPAVGSKLFADISCGDVTVEGFGSSCSIGNISCENGEFIASENFIEDVLGESEEPFGEVISDLNDKEDSVPVFTAKPLNVIVTRLDDVDVHSVLGELYLKAKQALKAQCESKARHSYSLASDHRCKKSLYRSEVQQTGAVDQGSVELLARKSEKQHCKRKLKPEEMQMGTLNEDIGDSLSTRKPDKQHERRLNALDDQEPNNVDQESLKCSSSRNSDQQHSWRRLDSEGQQTGIVDQASVDPLAAIKAEKQHKRRVDASEAQGTGLGDQDSAKFPLSRKFDKQHSKRRLDSEGLEISLMDQQSADPLSTGQSEKQHSERTLYSESQQADIMVQDGAKSSAEKLSLPPADMAKVPGLLDQVLDLGELPDALKCLLDAEVPLPELDADCFNLPHDPARWLPDDATVEKHKFDERPHLKEDPPFCPSDDSMLGDLTKACSLTHEGLVVLVPAVPPPCGGAQLSSSSSSSSCVRRAPEKPKGLAVWQRAKLEAFARDSCFEVDFDHNPELRIAFCRDRTVVLTPARCPPVGALLASVRRPPPSPEDDGMSTHELLPSEASPEPVMPAVTPPRHETSTSQLDGPTGRFALSGAQMAINAERVLTVLSLEVHVRTRGDLWPDPEQDAIQCILWCARGHGTDAPVEVGAMHWALCDPRLPDVEDLAAATLRRTGVAGPTLRTQVVRSEHDLLLALVDLVHRWDPDVLLGYDAERASWGYLCERAERLELDMHARLSRAPPPPGRKEFVGRILLSVWRILRKEVALNIYTFENAYYHVMHRRVPLFSFRTLSEWFSQDLFRWRVVEHYVLRARGNLELLEELNVFGKTSQMASIFGIQFLEVLSRGSQFRVESMLLRLVRSRRMVALSPSTAQRARQRAPEFIPLVLEPRAQLYTDPVVVLDFQSLYPSVIIAHNYCFSTCLGRIDSLGSASPFGCATLEVPLTFARSLRDHITVSPAGVAFVRSSIRKGLLPQMLDEVLGTRLMVKQAMSRCTDKTLRRVLDAQQLSLKLIANVTYGYTAASFSGRMPCVEVADSVVSKGREALERAIRTAEATVPGARVIYGDTDSLFVLLEGRSRREAFQLGQEIADRVTAQNPRPMCLRMEKVYQPCVLQTKKRYVGFAYEHPDQQEPKYDAKGIETVRRDTCPAVAKLLEKMLRVLFTSRDVNAVKRFVKLQFSKILAERVSPQDFIFAREFRGLRGYQPSACVPALEIARRLVRRDPRAEPLVGERVPYVVVYGHPGQRLIELVRQPHELLSSHSQLRLNAHYYVGRAIGPALNRVLRLLGANCLQWYEELPRPRFVNPRPGTVAAYLVVGQLCLACGGQSESRQLCASCEADPGYTALVLGGKVQRVQKALLELQAVCHSCMGFQASGACMSTDCPVLYKTARVTSEAQQALDWNSTRNATSSSS